MSRISIRRLVAAGMLAGAALTLSACYENSLTDLERGKACFEAGGNYVPYGQYGGHMMCEFRQEG